MIPDELDIFICKSIFDADKNKKDITNWDIAKNYSRIKNNNADVNDFNKTFVKIKARIKNYCVKGFFKEVINGHGDKVYEMDLDKITFAKHKFEKCFKQCLIIKIT